MFNIVTAHGPQFDFRAGFLGWDKKLEYFAVNLGDV
jgi:hypothetical protein